jgi:hypothetical protein
MCVPVERTAHHSGSEVLPLGSADWIGRPNPHRIRSTPGAEELMTARNAAMTDNLAVSKPREIIAMDLWGRLRTDGAGR